MKFKKCVSAALAAIIMIGMAATIPFQTVYAQPANDPPAADTLSEGLVLHASFDTDTISGSTLQDISGSDHDGTLVGSPAIVPGVRGDALSIQNPAGVAGSGSVTAQQYVTFGQPSALSFATENFTLSFWMLTENYGANNGTILGNKDYASGGNVGLAIGNFNNPNDKDIRINFSAKKGSRVEARGVPGNSNSWRHITASFNRGGNLSVYVDGALHSNTSMSAHKDLSAATGLDFVLGADGKKLLAASDLTLDELRVYNKNLDAETVAMLYAYEGSEMELNNMINTVNAIEPGAQYTKEAIEEMLLALNNGKASLQGMGAAATLALMTTLRAKYDTFLLGKEPLAAFFAVSDVHIRTETEQRTKDFIAGLADMYAINPNAFLINAGDNTSSGSDAQQTAFYNTLQKHSEFPAENLLIALGNHDVRDASPNWTNTPTGETPYWQTAYKLYMEKNAPYMPETNGKVYHDKWLGGYHFIVLNTENGLKDSAYISPEQLKWFEETLAENASSNKPIFVIVHQALRDTHWRSNILNSFGAQDAEVKAILAKYPQAITFSGHIHNGLGVAEAISRPFGTLVDLPSYNESDSGVLANGTGYYVAVYEDEVVFRARNFATGTWLPEHDTHVALPALPALYTQAASLNSQDYTPDSWASMEAILPQAEAILTRTYDQSVIASWDDARPPAEYFYHSAARQQIAELGTGLSAALDGLQTLDNPVFSQLRAKWSNYLLGGELNLENAAINTYVSELNTRADEYWADMIKSTTSARTRLWQDLDMTYIKGAGAAAKVNSGNISVTYYRLRDLTTAYFTKGTSLYGNAEVKVEIIKALDYLYENHYNESDSSTPVFGNWWHWEIGTPIASLSTALMLYDDLTPAQIANYAAAVYRYTPVANKPSGYPGSPAMTGANLIDKGTAVALYGILTENPTSMQHVKDAFKTVFKYVKTGDGFYEDGSFIQHQALAFMGGYGSDLYEKLSIFFVVLKDSNWELTYQDHAEDLVFDMIFKGIEPFFYNALFMDMVSGRDIVRAGSNDKERGVGILSAMLPMSDAMPTSEMKARFDSMAKAFIGADEDYFYSNCTNITAVLKANSIMQDSSIVPRTAYSTNTLFGSMDKLVYAAASYTLGLSMHSSRTYGHELINDEGKRTWNISDGMTYLYTPDTMQYNEGYWATVDPTRLSGTTVEHTVHANGAGDRVKNVYPWVGGSSIGLVGATGMQYRALGTSSARNGAEVKKSWFTFGDEIIALGSGISSTTGKNVETIVDNRKILPDASNQILVDGNAIKPFSSNGTPTQIQNPTWAHLQGNITGADIGYYFPTPATLNTLTETRTSNWNTQGTSTGVETNSFATLWFNHGASPTNAGYEYVLLPGKTADEVAAYAADNDILILANTPEAHAASKSSLGVTAVNFWVANAAPVGGIVSNLPASITVQRKDGVIEIAVSDPTQLAKAPIEVTVAAPGATLLSKADNITVLNSDGFIKISVNTTDLAGASSIARFEYDADAPLEVVSATQPAPFKVAIGTSFNAIGLPATLPVLANDGMTHALPVQWNAGAYNADNFGVYTLAGTLTLPTGMLNTAGITASVVVQVGEVSTLTTQDTYVQGGTDADKASSAYAIKGQLIIKNDAGAQSYTRKSYMQFSLENTPVNFDEAFLELQLLSSPSADFTIANIYEVENGWNASSLTFNTAPPRVSETPVAAITRDGANESLVQKFDISKTIRAAQEKGNTHISFEISIPSAAKNNYAAVYSSTTTNATALRPTISWAKTSTPVTVTHVEVQPSSITLTQGTEKQFTAIVTASGGADESVAWTMDGNLSAATTLSESGLLTLAEDEGAATITVTATSLFNTQQTATATVTVRSSTELNTDALAKLIEHCESLKPLNYTLDSWNVLEAKYLVAQDVLENDAATQIMVNNALAALQNALDALTRELDIMIAACKDMSNAEGTYIPAAWEIFQQAIASAEATAADTAATQEQLIVATRTLLAAKTQVMTQTAPSKIGLKTMIDIVTATDISGCTPQSIAAVEEALAAAQLVMDDPNATAEGITTAYNALVTAFTARKDAADKTDLLALIEQARLLDEANYTPTSWQSFPASIAAAVAVYENAEASEAEVTAAYRALFTSVQSLVARANFTALQAAINAAEGILANAGKYAPASIAGLREATNVAASVNTDKNSTQTQVNEATVALTGKISVVRLKANKSGLRSTFSAASAMNLSPFTAASADALRSAMAQAPATLEDENATQETVDALNSEIERLVTALQKTPVAPITPEPEVPVVPVVPTPEVPVAPVAPTPEVTAPNTTPPATGTARPNNNNTGTGGATLPPRDTTPLQPGVTVPTTPESTQKPVTSQPETVAPQETQNLPDANVPLVGNQPAKTASSPFAWFVMGIGSVILLAAIAITVYLLWSRRKQHNKDK